MLRRLLQVVPVVLAILVLNFLLLRLAPGDAAQVLAGEAASATPEYMAELRQRFGLDRPLAVQLLLYVKSMLVLDLGFSFRHNMPVLELIAGRLGPTLLLMVTTLLASVITGIVLGLLAAARAGSWHDTLISILALVSYATPLFWVGLMLIVIFSLKLDWLPTSGMETVAAFHEGWARVVDIARHLVLPALTLSLFYMALYVRLMRAAMLEQAGMDYVTTARAKGLGETRITLSHVLRNAVLPVVTMAGAQVGACSAAQSSWSRSSRGRASACSPSSPSSPATSTCCWGSSSCPRAWSSWSTWSSTSSTRCSIPASRYEALRSTIRA